MPTASVEAAPADVVTGAATATAASPPLTGGGYTFKKQNFISKYGKKKKNLKMIAMGLKQQKWPPSAATYTSIAAPLSTRLPKKYSDISGLEGRYTDPRTRIRYGTCGLFVRSPSLARSLAPSFARSLSPSIARCPPRRSLLPAIASRTIVAVLSPSTRKRKRPR